MSPSIRRRLIASYVLLTLLTVTATGFLAVFLIQRHAQRQEQEFLAANAHSIAQQSARFMLPTALHLPLQQLVQTAAFLGDAQVRILDVQENVLAASTGSTSGEAMAWVIDSRPAVQAGAVITDAAYAVTVRRTAAHQTPERIEAVPAPTWIEPPTILTGTVDVLLVQKSPSIWGNRLSFEPGVLVDDPFTIDAMHTISAPVAPVEQQGSPLDLACLAGKVNIEIREFVLQSDAGGQSVGDPARVASPLLIGINSSEEIVAANFAAVPQTPASLLSPTVVPETLAATQVVTAPIQHDATLLGYVELSRPPDFGAESLTAIRRAFLVAAVAAALLATIVGMGVGQGLTAPIQQLAQTAATMSAGDLSARAPVYGSDELGALARQFNQMADRLQASFDAVAAERDTLRRFVADASHELRTPITALRTFNELLQGPALTDQTAQREFLHESQEQLDRLEWITRNLLDLSRLDAGLAVLDCDQHEIGDLLQTAIAPFRTMARERNITLEDTVPNTPVYFTGDGARLERAVCNLFDNALKFTPNGGQIRFGASHQEDRIHIWVEDTGIGIDEDEAPHIFERFHRGRRATRSGSGLGLAIVQSVVHAHAGRVTVTSQVGQGSRFVIELPVASTSTEIVQARDIRWGNAETHNLS